MSRSRNPWTRRWAAGTAVAVALVVSGCGSGAVDGPDESADAASDRIDAGGGSGDGDRGDGGGSSAGDGGDTEPDRYSWSLPEGDLTPDDAHILYQALQGGCDAGEAALASDQYRNLSDEQGRLYRAAIAVCRGQVDSGRALFVGAGHGGSRSLCFILAGVVSVLEQRAPDTSGCPPNPGGETSSSSAGSEESGTSTGSSSTTEGGVATGTSEGESPTTEVTGVGDDGG